MASDAQQLPAPARVVITGGAGYVGHRLGLHIAEKCPELGQVVLFDVKRPPAGLPVGVEVVLGDLTSLQDVSNALRGATLVFHIAAHGMSGYEAMDEVRTRQVNVLGTQNVIAACKEQRVGRLVYVSSYNAVFDGKHPLVAATEESAAYCTEATTSAAYSFTKAEAERAVLAADGGALAGPGSGRLRACAIRPGGIWGPGELRNMPRIVSLARRGWLQFVFGSPSSVIDWLHVDNLIAALLLAARALQEQPQPRVGGGGDGVGSGGAGAGAPSCVAGGRVYFVHDGEPANNFEFLRPILEGLGYKWPRLRLPYALVYALALLMEVVCGVARNVAGRVVWVPLLCRMEVAKCGLTQYAKMDRARAELGFEPVQHSKQEVVAWYKARGFAARPQDSVVLAVQRVRTVRLVMALGMVGWVLVAWRSASRKRAAEADGAGLGDGAAALLGQHTPSTEL